MANRREIRAYDYVNRSYEAVRIALTSDPLAIFRQATARVSEAADGRAELGVRVGAIEVGAEIEVEIISSFLRESAGHLRNALVQPRSFVT